MSYITLLCLSLHTTENSHKAQLCKCFTELVISPLKRLPQGVAPQRYCLHSYITKCLSHYVCFTLCVYLFYITENSHKTQLYTCFTELVISLSVTPQRFCMHFYMSVRLNSYRTRWYYIQLFQTLMSQLLKRHSNWRWSILIVSYILP